MIPCHKVSRSVIVPNYEPRGRAFESLRACQWNQAERPIFGLASLHWRGGWLLMPHGIAGACRVLLRTLPANAQLPIESIASTVSPLDHAGGYRTSEWRRVCGSWSPEYSCRAWLDLLIVASWLTAVAQPAGSGNDPSNCASASRYAKVGGSSCRGARAMNSERSNPLQNGWSIRCDISGDTFVCAKSYIDEK